MKNNKTTDPLNLLSTIALAAVLAALAGCASANYQQGGKTGDELTSAAADITTDKGKVDDTVTALNELVASQPADLVARYAKFSVAVEDLQNSEQRFESRVMQMKKNGDKYLRAWDEQLAQIGNEDIKSRSAARKAEVQQKFEDAAQGCDQSITAFKPFMSDLRDIQKALGTDLTVEGVSAVKGPAEKSNKDAEKLKATMDQLAEKLKKLGQSMAVSTPPPAPPPTHSKSTS